MTALSLTNASGIRESALDAAIAARDGALAAFPEGVDAALTAARAALAAAIKEKEEVAAGFGLAGARNRGQKKAHRCGTERRAHECSTGNS